MAMKWGPVAVNAYTIYRDICKVQVRSLGIFEHTGCSEPPGQLGLGVLRTAFYVYPRRDGLLGLKNDDVVGPCRE